MGDPVSDPRGMLEKCPSQDRNTGRGLVPPNEPEKGDFCVGGEDGALAKRAVQIRWIAVSLSHFLPPFFSAEAACINTHRQNRTGLDNM